MACTAKQLASIFTRYERDRCAFVYAVANAARHEGSAAPLASLQAPRLLLPLLADPCPVVAHTAAFALGRLAGHSRAVASYLSVSDVVATLVSRLREQAASAAAAPESEDAAAAHTAAKRAVAGMLASLTRHAPELAGAVVAQGGLAVAVECLQETDAETREGAGGL